MHLSNDTGLLVAGNTGAASFDFGNDLDFDDLFVSFRLDLEIDCSTRPAIEQSNPLLFPPIPP